MNAICLKCRRGYGLSNEKTECKPCPAACTSNLCYYANENSCY